MHAGFRLWQAALGCIGGEEFAFAGADCHCDVRFMGAQRASWGSDRLRYPGLMSGVKRLKRTEMRFDVVGEQLWRVESEVQKKEWTRVQRITSPRPCMRWMSSICHHGSTFAPRRVSGALALMKGPGRRDL
jgi:hypothetical protein